MNTAAILVLLLHAAPISIEQLGFTVEVRDEQVVVIDVSAGSAAAAARLERGAVITRLISPVWSFARGPLASLAPMDLRDALTPPRGELLRLQVTLGVAKTRVVSMVRKDAGPSELAFTELVPPERLKRLSALQQLSYSAAVPEILRQRERQARDLVPLASLHGGAERAFVTSDRVEVTSPGASTARWVYYAGPLSFQCPHSAIKSFEVRSSGPMAPSVSPTRFEGPREGMVMIEAALWRVSEVRAACNEERAELPSLNLTVTVACEGESTSRVASLSRQLALSCGVSAPPSRGGPVLSLPLRPLLVGEQSLGIQIFWGNLRPTPRVVTIVELDGAGRELRRHQTLRPPGKSDAGGYIPVPIDTSRSRALALALWVEFPDGSSERTQPVPMTIESRAERDARQRVAEANDEKRRALLGKLLARPGGPCGNLSSTSQWLSEQPEVAAKAAAAGTSISRVTLETMQELCPGR